MILTDMEIEGLWDFIIERDDQAIAFARAIEQAVLEKIGEPVAWICNGELYEVQQWNLFSGDGPIPNQTPLYALPEVKK